MSRVMRIWIWPPLINKIIMPTLSLKYFHASPVWRATSPRSRWIHEPLTKVCALAAYFRTSPVASFLKKTDQNSVQLLLLLSMCANKLCRNHRDTSCWEYSSALMIALEHLWMHLICMFDRPTGLLGRSTAMWAPASGSNSLIFRIHWTHSWYTVGLVCTFTAPDTPKSYGIC